MAKKLAKAKRAAARAKGASVRRELKPTSNKRPQPRPLSIKLAEQRASVRLWRRGEKAASSAEKSEESAVAKRKGGPVVGTPSPMRMKLSPELHVDARRRYEQTDEFACDIAVDCGVDESTIRRMALREGWVRFVAPPRALPPVAKLLAQVEELEAGIKAEPALLSLPPRSGGEGRFDEHQRDEAGWGDSLLPGNEPQRELEAPPTPDPSPPREARVGGGEQEAGAVALRGSQVLAPQGDGEAIASADPQENIARFIRVVMAHLDEFELMRRDGKLKATQYLAVARGISILTEAFNKLQRLRAAQPGPNHDTFSDRHADTPADLDAYREELAQRIEAFLASRTDADAFADAAAAPAEGV